MKLEKVTYLIITFLSQEILQVKQNVFKNAKYTYQPIQTKVVFDELNPWKLAQHKQSKFIKKKFNILFFYFQLQKINEEQKIRIRNTERALQKAEVCCKL